MRLARLSSSDFRCDRPNAVFATGLEHVCQNAAQSYGTTGTCRFANTLDVPRTRYVCRNFVVEGSPERATHMD